MSRSKAMKMERLEEIFEETLVPEQNVTNSADSAEPEKKWTIISALDAVLSSAEDSALSDEFFMEAREPLDYLNEALGLNDIQVIVVAMLVDRGDAMSYRRMADFLAISRLRMMVYTDQIEALVTEKRWAMYMPDCHSQGFGLVYGVVTALRHNKPFVPEKLSDLTENAFLSRVANTFERAKRNGFNWFSKDEEWLAMLVEENPQLPICKKLLQYEDIHTVSLLLLLVSEYVTTDGNSPEIPYKTIDRMFPDDFDCDNIRNFLVEGTHELMTDGWIEHYCEDGMANPHVYAITQKTIDELISQFSPKNTSGPKGLHDRDMIKHTDIAEKQMFYNERESEQISRLRRMLSQEQFGEIQSRLKEKGLRTGVAVLLSGGPGTGKTESVKQLARATGRDLMMIDVSEVKSKWVGESEQNTKAIFKRYTSLCKSAKEQNLPAPILFINECDAILGKRKDGAEDSVDKMNNAMQNILLQALEDLEGVMICTTNLASNLDTAFERRFLMRVQFDKPDATVRAKIISAMIPEISESAAYTLASKYEMSGGQVENVQRKATIDYVLNGTRPSLESLEPFCKEEVQAAVKKITSIRGFAA